MKFELNGEFIRLGDLLKAAGLTGTAEILRFSVI